MKPAQIYRQYIWIINTLKKHGRLTLDELSHLWRDEEVAGGSPLLRASFTRHRDAILDMFGIIIDCDQRNGFKYFIANPEVLDDDSVERWMLSTLSVNTALAESAGAKDRILLEMVPAGEEFLPTIVKAIRLNRRVVMDYQRFDAEPYQKTVEPYALKLRQQRWYMLVFTGRHIATYALDRMLSLELTSETFRMPDGFSPQEYFAEYYGVMTDETPMAHIVIRAYGSKPNYLRTLPLHSSQRELESGEITNDDSSTTRYTDFSLHLRPTIDFLEALLSHGAGIEVLEPTTLRATMRQKIAENLKRY